MIRIRRIGELDVLEALEEEGHAFVAVATVGVAGVGEKPDKRLVELDASRRLRAVGGRGTFRTLSGDCTRTVGQKQSHQRLERKQIGRLWLLADQCNAGDLRQRPLAEKIGCRNAAETLSGVFAGVD